MLRNGVILLVSALIVCVLQVLLGPYLVIGTAFPNFILAFSLAVSLLRSDATSFVLPFVMGLIFDLMSGSLVGSLSLSLISGAVLARTLSRVFDRNNLSASLVTLVVSVAFTELLYCIVMLVCGYGLSLWEMLVFNWLPNSLYDGVLACLFFIVMRRLLMQSTPARHSEINQL